MDFNLNINVQIGVTPQLATFLTAILQNRPAQLPAIEAPAESEKPQTAPEVKNPEPETPTAPEPVEEASKEAPAKPLTIAEDIRAIMHRTRQRIEGEDYKENTGSEGYIKYHKKLTAQFKAIAAALGADKPSTLPEDQVEAFRTACDQLTADKDGNIETTLPF